MCTLSRCYARACEEGGTTGVLDQEEREIERERERERERETKFILSIMYLQNPLQRGSAPAWPSLTNRRCTHTHTHRHGQTRTDNVDKVEPLQGTRRPLAEAARACGKTANVVSQRRAWQPLPNEAVRLQPSLCFLPAANRLKKKKKKERKKIFLTLDRHTKLK